MDNKEMLLFCELQQKGIAGSNGVYIYKNIDDFLKVMAELEKQYDEKRRFNLCNLQKI